MALQNSYYLPLHENLFEIVRLLAISPKSEGVEADSPQKIDKDGVPVWTLSALVKIAGSVPETEVFTISAMRKLAEEIGSIPEFSTIKLIGLSGGKWSRANSDKTKWSFQITGIKVAS